MRRVLISLVLILIVLGSAGAVSGLLVSLKKKPKKQTPPPAITRVLAPKVEVHENFNVEIIAHGTARPKYISDISPRVGGKIVFKSPKFFSGRTVFGADSKNHKADKLFEIDPEPYQIAADNAAQAVELLNAEIRSLDQDKENLNANRKLEARMVLINKDLFERTQTLLKKGVGTPSEVSQQEATLLSSKTKLQATENALRKLPIERQKLKVRLEQAKLEKRRADLSLNYATYFAPITGRVISCDLEIGEQIVANQVCGKIYGTQLMEVPVSVQLSDRQWIDPKTLQAWLDPSREQNGVIKIPATVEWQDFATGKTLSWSAAVERLEAGLDAQTRTAILVLLVDNYAPENLSKKANRILDLGMYCKVKILGRKIPKAYFLPRTAVLPSEEVYVAVETEKKNEETGEIEKFFKLELRKVKIARFSNDKAMILPGSGLKDGDRVITSQLLKPVEGMRLELIQTSAGKPATAASQADRTQL